MMFTQCNTYQFFRHLSNEKWFIANNLQKLKKKKENTFKEHNKVYDLTIEVNRKTKYYEFK